MIAEWALAEHGELPSQPDRSNVNWNEQSAGTCSLCQCIDDDVML